MMRFNGQLMTVSRQTSTAVRVNKSAARLSYLAHLYLLLSAVCGENLRIFRDAADENLPGNNFSGETTKNVRFINMSQNIS
jgi:hypothetical protein